MYLTQLKLHKTPASAPIIARFLSNSYAEHQVLWELAGRPRDAKRDFLYRAEVSPEGLSILLLSNEPFSEVPEPWVVASKPYRPRFESGQRLAFKLRVSPTIDKVSGQAGVRGFRQDLVMLKYRELGGDQSVESVTQLACEQWLNTRAESAGFRLIEIDAHNYRKLTVRKGHKVFTVPTVDVEGVLEITDANKFIARQTTGYGKDRFAGQGLMLVRPCP